VKKMKELTNLMSEFDKMVDPKSVDPSEFKDIKGLSILKNKVRKIFARLTPAEKKLIQKRY
jgi:hypothetical protein